MKNLISLVLTLVAIIMLTSTVTAAEKPNVIYIMADELG